MMGVIKKRLIVQGLQIDLGLPTPFFGQPSLEEKVKEREYSGFLFDVDGLQMECWLSIDVKKEDITVVQDDEAAFEEEDEDELF